MSKAKELVSVIEGKIRVADAMNRILGINNIMATKMVGQSLTGYTISGTRFAIDGAKKHLDDAGIEYSSKPTSISFAIKLSDADPVEQVPDQKFRKG